MGRVTDTKEKLLEAALQLVWEESVSAASVDAICEKARVRKGSFYHFFESKTELVLAALERHFEESRVDLDRIFSPSIPPTERLKGFFERMYQKQAMKREQAGRVVGCPYASAGMSCAKEDQPIREKVGEIFAIFKKYFETALRDGKADGSIPVKDIPATVESVFDYIEGTLTLARIQNNLTPVQTMARGAFALMGLEGSPTATPAKA